MSYSGQVQGVSKWTGAAVAAFARSVKGNFSFGAESIEEYGAGGQVAVGAGTVEAALDLSDVVGVAATDVAKWFPTSAGVQVASFPGFVVTLGGKQFTLTDGQPGAATFSLAAGDNLFKGSLSAKFATCVPAAASVTHAYTTMAPDTNNTIVVQWGAADIGCLSFDLGNGLDAPPIVNPMDTKSVGSLRLPSGYQVAAKLPTITTVLAEELDTDELFADSWTPANLVIDCATFGTITISGVCEAKLEGEVTDGSSVVGYTYSWKLGSGTAYNRVVFS